jgi:hypothetical protein
MLPVCPHYIYLEMYTRERLELIDRTCYASSVGMWPVEQTGLVEPMG